MIFAEIDDHTDYRVFHSELAAFLSARFSDVKSGLQGDSWIWILDGGEKVEIDTFSSMKHQIKSAKSGQHVQNVIQALLLKYRITVYAKPQLEGHEHE